MNGYDHSKDPVRHISATIKLAALFLSLGFLLVLSASNCSPVISTAQSLANGEIDSDLRGQIHDLNNAALNLLKTGDSAGILEMMADIVKSNAESEEQTQSFLRDYSKITGTEEFDVHAEYYWQRKGIGELPCVIEPAVTDDFGIEIEGINDEMYFSLLKSNDDFQQQMISIAYIKSGTEWKIYSLRIGLVEIAGKNALEWYEEAKNLYDQGYLVPSALRQKMASASLQPAPFLHYEREAEIVNFSDSLAEEVKNGYTFPAELSDLPGKPIILSIEPQFLQMQMLPKIV